MSEHRVLVTGSSGTLGAALVTHLAREWNVVQLDLRPPSSDKQKGLSTVYTGSFLDTSLVRKAVEGVEAVVHCGAIPGSRPPLHEVVQTNVQGTFNMLEAAGESDTVARFVFISSIMWHGFHDEPPRRNMPSRLPIDETVHAIPSDCYATTKVQGEAWCKCYADWYGKPVVALRPSHIVGIERLNTFSAMEHARPEPHLHDYLGVWDLVDAVERALHYDPPKGFDAFLLNADDQYTKVPSVELVRHSYPSVSQVDRDKLDACDGFGALVDCTKAKERLGWQPSYRCRR
ncbi:MAG: NAD(P)-dependent oxidoreductase [Candidatus Hydrogenedentes bacterium]|nr:NAD(P)-dependent oxidoreductase [Candidatus Hydrogenedentota bacterium]